MMHSPHESRHTALPGIICFCNLKVSLDITILALYLLGIVAIPDFAVLNTSCQKDNEGWRENGTSADRCHNHGAKI